jgi:hypothetical protein
MSRRPGCRGSFAGAGPPEIVKSTQFISASPDTASPFTRPPLRWRMVHALPWINILSSSTPAGPGEPVESEPHHGDRVTGHRSASQVSSQGSLSLAVASLALGAGTLTAARRERGRRPWRRLDSGAGSEFTAGDVVVYRVGDGSSELSGSGSPGVHGRVLAVRRPAHLGRTADDVFGLDNPLVASGSAGSEGGLTLSANGAVPGGHRLRRGGRHERPVLLGRRDRSAHHRHGRRVRGREQLDRADRLRRREQPAQRGQRGRLGVLGRRRGGRRALRHARRHHLDLAGRSTDKNQRQLEIADGQLYTSADPTKAGITVATVGSGLPTSGTNAVTNLPFASSAAAPVEPYAYSLLTLGSGSARTPSTWPTTRSARSSSTAWSAGVGCSRVRWRCRTSRV